MARKPLWISVSGMYGTGKSTLVDFMYKTYKAEGKKVIKYVMPLQAQQILQKLKNTEDIHSDILQLAKWIRAIALKIRKIQLSGKYEIVLTDGSILDLLLYASMYGYMYTDVLLFLGLSSIPTEDFIIALDADVDTVAYPMVYTVNGFLEKFKSKDVLKLQRVQLRKLLKYVVVERAVRQYYNAKILPIEVEASDSKRHVHQKIKKAKDFLPKSINIFGKKYD